MCSVSAGTPGEASPAIELRDVVKTYGTVAAVDHVSLDVREGELLFLLGPSGCGKTTTLRLIAGLAMPDRGSILIRGTDVGGLPPYARDLGVVFQSYALFPHMTVAQNVAFGLRMRRLPRPEITRRIRDALLLVDLAGLEHRYPRQLSGGQQQRVALARAIVVQPNALLLDEPLSNLDAKLRQQVRVELRTLQERLGITTVFVTHDQEEALVMGDRIAVMHAGRVVQVGTPAELYERPATRFVAHFIGESNFLVGLVAGSGAGEYGAVVLGHGVPVTGRFRDPLPQGRRGVALIRPERVSLGPDCGDGLRGTVAQVFYLGAAIRYEVTLPDGQRCLAQVGNTATTQAFRPGDPVSLRWSADDVVILPDE